MIGVAVALIVSSCVGWWTLEGLSPARNRLPGEIWMRSGMALALGSGLCAVGGFLADLVVPRAADIVFASDAALLLASAALRLRRPAGGPAPEKGLPEAVPTRRLGRFLSILLSTAAAFSMFFFLMQSRALPNGGIDAATHWNLRGRVLSEGGRPLIDYFDTVRSVRAADYPLAWNWDYPLLLPAALARGWRYSRGLDPRVPAAVALTFASSVVLVVLGAVRVLGGSSDRAALAGLTLLGTPFFVMHAAAFYADVPTAAFSLAALVAIVLGLSGRGSRWFCVAGLFAGLSAFTKNDGALHWLAAFAALLAPGQGRRSEARRIRFGAFIAGSALPLSALALYRWRLSGARNWLVGGAGGGALRRLWSPERWSAILRAAADFAARGWHWTPPAIVIAAAALLLFRGRRPAAVRRAEIVFFGVAACGSTLVYLLTRYDVAWQLSVSLDRLLLQFWPAAIVSLFAAAIPPTETVAGMAQVTP